MRTFLVASIFVLPAFLACRAENVTCVNDPATGACTADGVDGGAAPGDAGFDVVAPPGCDLTKSPKDSPACVDNAVGVFVAPSGDDAAAGSKALPLKTIAKGVEAAAAKGLPRVYVCEGTYAENVEVKSPVSIYGGLSCAWASTDVKPKLAPPKGIALRITKVTSSVLVEDMEIVGSADAATPGDSAIGVFVSESASVTLRNDVISAGAGTSGADGTASSNWAGTASPGMPAAMGGGATPCNCLDGKTSSTGGKGGAIAAGGDPGTSVPAVGDLNGGGGGNTCLAGGSGANGLATTPGQAASSPGVLSDAGWESKNTAGYGGSGNPGQGGGGGGGRTGVTGGGGGACGGCGGAGGSGGGNGGASFAVLVSKSAVTVVGGTLQAGQAGSGGAGGKGQDGQGGGTGGAGACDGGNGGNGAGGSGGGGGAGGHSAPIAFIGTEPKVTGATLTPGAKGGAGAGGRPGAGPGNPGAAGNPGAEGKSQNVLAL